MKYVSLMWDQSLGSGVIRMLSADILSRCLPGVGMAIGDLGQTMQELGSGMKKIRGAQSLAVPEQMILTTKDGLVPLSRRLATANGMGHGANMKAPPAVG